ncbi:uncharacterized protein LOC119734158 [Patiria miniata]|uniref:Insulin-like domain-containing protein n=1 Tax=Patiria miniata TaxID=46514 RepID=A0A914AHG0_PATMI|nr:uncharacterized protein LOC119734158 [Patiria miniata]
MNYQIKIAWSGPRFRVCGSTIHSWSRFVCHPSGLIHHKRDNDEFLSAGEANTFLTSDSDDVGKRGLHEECCHEGCWWEEILEHC